MKNCTWKTHWAKGHRSLLFTWRRVTRVPWTRIKLERRRHSQRTRDRIHPKLSPHHPQELHEEALLLNYGFVKQYIGIVKLTFCKVYIAHSQE